MALARVTTWSSGQVLTASALNGEFDNIISNAVANPLIANLACGDFDLTGIDELAFTTASAVASATGRLRRSATTTLSWHNGTEAFPLNWVKGADLASASSLTLGTDGNYFHVTGTTGITAISARIAGSVILLRFAGALTLTHNATSLILIGAANRTTAANDTAIFVSEGAGNWREISRNTVAATMSLAGTSLAEATTTAGSITNLLNLTLTTSIGAGEAALLLFTIRKAAGAANDMRGRVGVNSTYVTAVRQWIGAANAVGQGMIGMFIGPQNIALHTRPGIMFVSGYDGTTNNETVFAMDGTAFPNAAITSIQVDAQNNGGSITVGAANLLVYRLLAA